MAIETIHEAVLTRLLSDKSLRFTLRTKNKRNDDRLSKGYWFTGNDTYLTFSFWEGSDWRNKTSNIFFGINAEGKCWLEVVDNDNTEKARFFEEIAPIIGLQRFNNKERSQWKKSYNNDNNYLTYLEEFLKKDKPIVDAFIQAKGLSSIFPPISEEKFKENLTNVEEWRSKLNAEKSGALTPSYNEDKKKTYPIRLKNITLENIGHFRSIELNLDQQVTCLIGENGSGKTSILRGIALGLAGIGEKSENTMIDPTDDAIQKMLRIDKVEGDAEVFTSSGQIKIVYNNNQEKNVINFEFKKGDFYDKEKKETKKDYVEVDDIGSDLSATENNHFKNLVLGFSQIKTMPETSNGHSTIQNDENGRIAEVTPLIYSLPDRAFDNFSKWIIQLWNPVYDAGKRRESLEVLKQIFGVIQQIVGGQFEIMPMKEDQKEIFIKTNDAPEGIPMRLISQGYNNVIGWVGYFMQRLWEVTPNSEAVTPNNEEVTPNSEAVTPNSGKADFKQTPAVCLIDEIDTYLHPKWEQKILSVLAENFPNTQFVVTTHSPLIITHLKNTDNSVAIYHISEQGVENVQASGQDISTAMLLHFGIERRPPFYQKQIDNLFSNFEKFENNENDVTIEFLEKQLSELTRVLGKEDPDVETAMRILEALKIPMD